VPFLAHPDRRDAMSEHQPPADCNYRAGTSAIRPVFEDAAGPR
jgi:hypothetical protein